MRDLGKIDRSELKGLFNNKLGRKSDKVIQDSAFGVDTGIIQISDNKGLVVASDPASFIPSLGIKESAWLSVILTANDVATSGYLPEYAQFVLNLTHKMTNDALNEYWGYIHQFCLEIGISITGGHTGFDNLGQSTLAGGTTMFATVDNAKVKCSSFAKPNQDLILTKSAALSSASILAKSFPNHTKKNLGNNIYESLVNSFYQTSIIPEVKILKNRPDILQEISAMHDVTEGGSLGAIYELCEASKIGVKVDIEAITIGKSQNEICNLFQINPLRSTGAGSLLIACKREMSKYILEELQRNNIAAAVVGETLPYTKGKKIYDSKGENELTYWEKDPYWNAFFNAIEKQLK